MERESLDVVELEERSKRTINFLLLAGRMKTNKRTGWVNHRVNLPESIADHSYRLSLAALLAAPYCEASPEKSALIAIAHDLAESITGDIVPHDPMGKDAKKKLETLAMDELNDALCPHKQDNLFISLWNEYENQSSNEGKLCKDIDKFEMAIQAYEYEMAQPHLDLSDFYDSVKDKIKSLEVKSWLNELMRRRMEFRNNNPISNTKLDIASFILNGLNSIEISPTFIYGAVVGTVLGLYLARVY
jgi:putative hydrolase of HD superfamily